jgi:hypothetical protein
LVYRKTVDGVEESKEGGFGPPKPKLCNPRIHGWVLEPIKKSETMTWLVCLHCLKDGKIEPCAWQETTKEDLMRAPPNEEELQKYV